MKVEKVKEENGELELSITASPEEVDKAFTDGLDVFIDQFQLRGLEGETALQKIYNAMSPEEARDAVSSAVISYLIPFALDQENIIPMTSSSVDAESDPVEGKEFTFNVTILPKPEFETYQLRSGRGHRARSARCYRAGYRYADAYAREPVRYGEGRS